MPIGQQEIMATALAASFAAGLNVYAMLATLGLLSRAGAFQLPSALHPVESWWVISASLAMFILEFFADKVPAFDLIWNALHTFVRIPLAALVSYGAASHLSPAGQITAALLGAGVAFAAHGSKMAVRAAVTPSPEPVSNIALSVGEDVLAIGLTWFATRHPYWGALAAGMMVMLAAAGIRWIYRAMKSLFRGANRKWHELESASPHESP